MQHTIFETNRPGQAVIDSSLEGTQLSFFWTDDVAGRAVLYQV